MLFCENHHDTDTYGYALMTYVYSKKTIANKSIDNNIKIQE